MQLFCHSYRFIFAILCTDWTEKERKYTCEIIFKKILNGDKFDPSPTPRVCWGKFKIINSDNFFGHKKKVTFLKMY